jgi:hypothetical protein
MGSHRLLSIVLLLLAATLAHAGEAAAKAGGVAVGFDRGARVTGLAVAGARLPAVGKGGFRIAEVLPGGKRVDHGWWEGKPLAGLTLKPKLLESRKYIDVTTEIKDTTGKDRALIVSFTLPVKTAGTTFENTLREHYRLTGKNSAPQGYEGTRHVGRWNALRHSNVAFTVLNFGDRALAIAVPLDEPRLFVMKAGPAGYTIEFQLGLSRATKKFPGKASVRFILYAVNPNWGIRDAAARYYKFFPELFKSRCSKHGNWGEMPEFTKRWAGKSPEDFALQLALDDVQWWKGKMFPPRAKLMRELGCYVFHHREPWGWWHDQRDYAKTKQPGDRYDPVRKQTATQELAEIKKQAAGVLPIKQGTNQLCSAPPRLAAQAAVNSYCVHPGEKKFDGGEKDSVLRYMGWFYGCSQIAMNMDPELPTPNRAQIADQYQFGYFDKWKDRGKTDPHGISWDSLTDWTLSRWLNFRREHFATADYPLVYSPRDGRLAQLILFTHIEFAKWQSEKVRGAGGLVFVNTRMKEIFYAAPYVDAFGIEETLDNTKRYGFEELSMLRCSANQKPVSFYKAGNTSEAGIRRGVLFGIFPGAAGLKEGQRALWKKYMPALKAATEAGWQPVTRARTDNDKVMIERFGPNKQSRDTAWFTLYNDSGTAQNVTIAVDVKALGWTRIGKVRELIEKRAIRLDASKIALKIEPREALIVRVTRAK